MSRAILLLFVILLSAPCFAESKLSFKDAWVREAPPMAKNLAGYAEVTNAGQEALTIVSIISPIFERVEMHVTTLKNGMMRMKHLENLTLAAGESVYFEPGGKHFMLIKPKKPIKAGLTVPFLIKLQSEEVFSFDLKVRK